LNSATFYPTSQSFNFIIMKAKTSSIDRRNFLRTSAALTSCAGLIPWVSANATASINKTGLYVIGPMEGYSPQIGTLVSMLNYNRQKKPTPLAR
jgi:hypothetical protein